MKLCLFVFAIFLALPLITGCKEPTGNERLSVTEDGAQTLNDIGIATIPTPPGWSANRSGGNTAVIFLRKDAAPKNPDEMISIDIGTPTSENAKESADNLAKKFGGNVAKQPIAVDSETAYKVSIPPNFERMMPRECVVVHHNEQVCFFFGASKSKDDIWPTISEIAESLKWK